MELKRAIKIIKRIPGKFTYLITLKTSFYGPKIKPIWPPLSPVHAGFIRFPGKKVKQSITFPIFACNEKTFFCIADNQRIYLLRENERSRIQRNRKCENEWIGC